MFFVARCVAVVGGCVSLVVLMFDVCCLLCCAFSFYIYCVCAVFVVCCLLIVAYCLLVGYCALLVVICCLILFVCVV